MSAIKQIMIETVVLSVIAIVLGAAVNTVRAKGSIDWTKNYFAVTGETAKPAAPTKPLDDPLGDRATHVDGGATVSKHEASPYQPIALTELKEMVGSGDWNSGRWLFVDARGEGLYLEGHIEGAVRCDPYQVTENIDTVMSQAEGAEKVVVYCEGGDCEDSVFMCRELLDAGVGQDQVYLYAGGWEEWTANDLPIVAEDAE